MGIITYLKQVAELVPNSPERLIFNCWLRKLKIVYKAFYETSRELVVCNVDAHLGHERIGQPIR